MLGLNDQLCRAKTAPHKKCEQRHPAADRLTIRTSTDSRRIVQITVRPSAGKYTLFAACRAPQELPVGSLYQRHVPHRRKACLNSRFCDVACLYRNTPQAFVKGISTNQSILGCRSAGCRWLDGTAEARRVDLESSPHRFIAIYYAEGTGYTRTLQ
jgi:hypothetical protein